MNHYPVFAHISVHKKPTESEEKVLTSIKNLLPDIEPNIEKEVLPSYWGGGITSFSIRLNKSSARKLFKKVTRELQGKYSNWIKERLDTENHDFYIRVDKQLAFQEILKLSEGGNVIHIRFSFPGYIKLTEGKLQAIIKKIRKKEEAN